MNTAGHVRLAPLPREKVWGRKCLAPYFADSERPVGEVWFLGERELPLLVKFLYTSERLSIQVHPADGDAPGVKGKTEMWHVLLAEPEAALGLGFREPITRERLRDAALTGEIEGLLHWMPVQAGETYFVPAHTVHAIGAGLVLCEIQQNSDTTYRLYDYGRPRELHLDQALPICDLSVHPGRARPVRLSAARQQLVGCDHFVTELLTLAPGEEFTARPETCELCIVLEGCLSAAGQTFRTGETWQLCDSETRLQAGPSPARCLRTYVPKSR